MKAGRRSTFTAIVLGFAAAGVLASAGGALASQTVHAAACQVNSSSDVIGFYPNNSLMVLSPLPSNVQCPTNVDHDIGKAQWDISVKDDSDQNFICLGSVYNANGSIHALTATVQSSGRSEQILTVSATGSTWTNTRSYAVSCSVPPTTTASGEDTRLYNIRLY